MTKKDFSIIVGVAFLLFALSGCRRSDIQTAQAEAPQEKAVSVLTYEDRKSVV